MKEIFAHKRILSEKIESKSVIFDFHQRAHSNTKFVNSCLGNDEKKYLIAKKIGSHAKNSVSELLGVLNAASTYFDEDSLAFFTPNMCEIDVLQAKYEEIAEKNLEIIKETEKIQENCQSVLKFTEENDEACAKLEKDVLEQSNLSVKLQHDYENSLKIVEKLKNMHKPHQNPIKSQQPSPMPIKYKPISSRSSKQQHKQPL